MIGPPPCEGNIKYYKAKLKKEHDPKVGLIALSTDKTIEKDFNHICVDLPLNIFINRIHNQNPLTQENLLKMQDDLESVAKKILPDEKIDTIVYGCTSGTIAIGEDKVKEKILLAKPDCYVTTPITSTIKALKQMNIKRIAFYKKQKYKIMLHRTDGSIEELINKKKRQIPTHKLTECLLD